MILSYLQIAWRNIVKNKLYSSINIIGLATGIATCLIIMLFVNHELGYDRYNEKADRIVRVTFQGNVQGEKMNESTVMPPVAQTLKADFPEVEAATRIRDYGKPNLIYKDKSFKEDAFAFVDPNFFQVFTLPLIAGDPKTALVEPNTIVITKAFAKKYFGNNDPMGKIINFQDGNFSPFKVTGLIDRVPVNSHFQFEVFASMSGLPEAAEPSWTSSNFYTYLVLPVGYDYKKLETKLPKVVEKYIGPQMQQALGMTMAQFKAGGNRLGLVLQPLTAIHLHADFANDLSPSGDIRYIYIFCAIAIFMLLIACINFINLSTAGASKRAREVGIRKVLGSSKTELVWQFLTESTLITAIALLMAIGFVYLAMPFFNQLASQNLTLNFTENLFLVPGLFLFMLTIGILAGAYPAFFLSSFKPVAVLKGKLTSGNQSVGIRSSLVVFQFLISIILIFSTTVVFNQLSYIQNKKLGYDKEQIIILPAYLLGKNSEIFRQQLQNDPRVSNISRSGFLPAGPSNNNNFFVSPVNNSSQLIKTLRYDVDENYIPVLGIEMLSGRNFFTDFSTDSSGVIINETAARAFGWKNNATGKTLTTNFNKGEKKTYTILGVVKDFHFKSLHERISPLVMVLAPDPGMLIVKLKPGDTGEFLTSLKTKWTKLSAEEPLSYSFLDDRYNRTYESEQKAGQILGIFSGLTIFIACLGLFGLATFTAEQRKKEIGIRKVLGASVAGIMNLISLDFLKLVLVAFLIASPLAWYAMNRWLQNFAYRITIDWWIFALAGILAVLIALATVSFQAIKAALANPVKSLRTE